jgi:hypothetical protein
MPESPHKLSGALEALFREYDGPPFALRLWDGWSWRSSSTEPEAWYDSDLIGPQGMPMR